MYIYIYIYKYYIYIYREREREREMYTCVYIHMYIYIYIYTHVCTRLIYMQYRHICLHTCMVRGDAEEVARALCQHTLVPSGLRHYY